MGKVEIKKQLVIESITNHLLIEGLNKTGLRRLAQVAGTSDRMLIYYFGSKDALLDEALRMIATNVTTQLDELLGTQPRSAADLLTQLTTLTMNETFEPALRLWFELVGLAARGQEPYLSNARLLANNWITWITSRLDDPSGETPSDLYAHLEGRLMLKLIQDGYKK